MSGDNSRLKKLLNRKKSLLTSTISGDKNGEFKVLGEPFLEFISKRSFFEVVGCLLLRRKNISSLTESFIERVFKLLVDHGPYVSGAVNTIIASRAGKDLVSSLSAGLLTIGPRFGGAINAAAQVFFCGVLDKKDPAVLVEEFARRKKYIPGIGHKKYRVDMPDPRCQYLLEIAKELKEKRCLTYAKEIEAITVKKKPNLILNIDGTIAALGLDILREKEEMSNDEIAKLLETEFFNAFFVLARSVGFIAHFLDQKRINEGLFRLSEEDVFYADEL